MPVNMVKEALSSRLWALIRKPISLPWPARDVGRRVSPLSPESSLLLQKPTMRMPHGGGLRLVPGSQEYQLLAAWIADGCPAPSGKAREVSKLHITPSARVGQLGMQQQLQVVAEFQDGSQRDVTSLARFDSLDEAVVEVSKMGLVKAVGRGQAPIMVRYQGQASLATMVIPLANSVCTHRLAIAKFHR